MGCRVHNDGNIRGAGDVESELIASYAEIPVTSLDERVPQDRRPAGKSVTPAGGARQIIYGRIIVEIEDRRSHSRGIAAEKNIRHANASLERVIFEIGDTGGNDEAWQ